MGDRIIPDTSRTYDTSASGAFANRELPCSPGTVVWKDGKAYRFVKMTVGAAAVGDMLAFSTAADLYTVIAGTTDLPAAGLCITAIAQNSYGWIQCYGLNEAEITTDGNVTVDDVCSLTTSNDIKPATEAEMVGAAICGTALFADTGTALAAGKFRLECPTNSVSAIA